MDKLPNFNSALEKIARNGKIPEQCWKALDKELTEKLLRASAALLRPIGK